MPRRPRVPKANAPKGHNHAARHSDHVAARGKIIALREEGFTYAQISEKTGYTRNTIRKWLFR